MKSALNIILSVLFFWTLSWSQSYYFKISWDVNPEPDISHYEIYRGVESGNVVFVGQTDEIFYYDFDIQPNQQYYYRIKAVNESGDKSDFSEAKAGIVRLRPIDIEDTGEKSVKIQWTSEVPVIGQIKFDTNYPLQKQSATSTNYSTQHEFILNDLDPGKYYFSCLGWDEQGNLITTQDSVFVIGNVFQNEPEIIVYPNPVKKNGGSSLVYFSGLPLFSKISVYNMMGETIWHSSAESQFFVWDIGNTSGKKVGSGVYIYLIRDEKGSEIYRGELVVIN